MTAPIPPTLESFKVPVSGLVPYGPNPRRGNIDVIVESLTHHGQYRPIVVRARTFEVLAGNHTLAAAKELGWTEIAATFVDVSDDEAARIVLVDNRSADLGTYDDQVLTDLLASLPDLGGTGFDPDDLATLLALQDPPMRAPTDLDATLAEADASLWPWVHCQLDPDTYERFRDLPGESDAEKLTQLLVVP